MEEQAEKISSLQDAVIDRDIEMQPVSLLQMLETLLAFLQEISRPASLTDRAPNPAPAPPLPAPVGTVSKGIGAREAKEVKEPKEVRKPSVVRVTYQSYHDLRNWNSLPC